MLAAASAAYQLKETCVRQMAAELQSLHEDDMKQHLLSLPAPQHNRQRGTAQQQHQERLEQVLAEYKELKERRDSDDPGNVLYVVVRNRKKGAMHMS
jgi:1,2-phenylacetyl-CoA epoxidase catalytic subunit